MRCGNLRFGYSGRDYQAHWRTCDGALVSCLVYDWQDERWYWLHEVKPSLRAEVYVTLCANVSIELARQFAQDKEAGRAFAA